MPARHTSRGYPLRGTSGAFDLPSVLIGVAVVAILAVGVMATIFGAIPWAQNRAAAQDLAALTTAQGTAKAKDDTYAGPTLMAQLGYLSDDKNLDFAVSSDESCWVGVTKAKSGKHFYSINGSAPAELTRDTKPGCLGSPGFTKISAPCGINHGSVYCWGPSDRGMLGNGTDAAPAAEKPVKVGGPLEGKTIQDVDSGYYHVCALDTGGQVYCWGQNNQGQMGNGKADGATEPPALVQGALTGKKVTSITADNYHTCAVADERLYCWGFRANMGDAASSERSLSPLLIDGGVLAGVAVKSVTASQWDACVLSVAGKAYCWGNTDISNGKRNPVAGAEVLMPGGFTAISIEDALACGIASGKVFCWGSGALGSMYSGSTAPQPVGSELPGGITGILLNSRHSACAGDSSKNWYCWNVDGDTPNRYPVHWNASFEGESIDSMSGSCVLAGGKIYCSEVFSLDPAKYKKVPSPSGSGSWVDTVLDGGKLP